MYRAIKWTRCSDDVTPIGKWHASREDALEDVLEDYAPHRSASYEIQGPKGRRPISDAEFEAARDRYHGAMQHRDAVGVWG